MDCFLGNVLVIIWQQPQVQHASNSFELFAFILTPGRRSLSLHAEKVSYMYQSENKHEINENHLVHGFANLSMGKQNMKHFEEYHFLTQKVERFIA